MTTWYSAVHHSGCPGGRSRVPRRRVNATGSLEIEVPSVARDHRQDPFEALARCCPSPLAGGRGCRTCSSRFEPRLDPCSLALAGAFKAACTLATSASGCFHEHDHGPLEHPKPLEGDWGCCIDPLKVAFPSRATAEASPGQGPRTPYLGSPQRDCSRWRLRPDPHGFGHLMSREPRIPLSGATRETSGTAGAAHVCTTHAATGSCGASTPRRGRSLTNPRGLPSRDCPLRTGVVCQAQPKLKA